MEAARIDGSSSPVFGEEEEGAHAENGEAAVGNASDFFHQDGDGHPVDIFGSGDSQDMPERVRLFLSTNILGHT
jgi:hypothetical protein